MEGGHDVVFLHRVFGLVDVAVGLYDAGVYYLLYLLLISVAKQTHIHQDQGEYMHISPIQLYST